MITIRQALQNARARFAAVSDSPGLDAHVLLATVLGVERAHLLGHPEQPLTETQAERYEAWVARHESGEPLAYILGRRGFYDLDLMVTPDVLIPRPETELLLERALAFAKDRQHLTVVDVGTGSGALAVTFAVHVPDANVYAIDVSEAALSVARENARAHGMGSNIVFANGNLLAPLVEIGVTVDIIMANLPYIASDEVPRLDVSRYEPTLALDGGPDGLDLVRQLLAQVPQVARPGALVLLEIGAGQGAAALALAGPNATLRQDYAGLDRIIEFTVKSIKDDAG